MPLPFSTLGIAEYIPIVEAAVGDTATDDSQCIGKTIIDANYVGQDECESEVDD